MAIYWGVIEWLGDSGSPKSNLTPMVVPLCLGAAQLSAFMVAMDAHTLCKYKQFNLVYSLGYVQAAPGVNANIDKKAIIYYRDPDDLKVHSLTYPAPIAADIEDTPSGKRIKDSSVATIVGYINTMTGKSYVPLHGVYYEKEEL